MALHGNEYRTHDTPLAAFLLTEGFKLSRIDYNEKQAIFTFLRDGTEDLDNAIMQYQAGTAKGNIVLFYNSYRSLVRRIKERL